MYVDCDCYYWCAVGEIQKNRKQISHSLTKLPKITKPYFGFCFVGDSDQGFGVREFFRIPEQKISGFPGNSEKYSPTK